VPYYEIGSTRLPKAKGKQMTTNNQLNTGRLIIAIEGTDLAVRVVPHRTDPKQLILKSTGPDVGARLAKLMGVECGPTWKGGNFFLTPVMAEVFAGSLPGFLAKLAEVARVHDVVRAQEKVQGDLLAGFNDEEAGTATPLQN